MKYGKFWKLCEAAGGGVRPATAARGSHAKECDSHRGA